MKAKNKAQSQKRPMKKLIALWVVFAMLIVPFANYAGDKDGAKAESGAGAEVVTNNPDTNGTIIADNLAFTVETEEVTTTVPGEGGGDPVEVTSYVIQAKTGDALVQQQYTLLKNAQGFEAKPGESTTKPDAAEIANVSFGYVKVTDTINDTLSATDTTIVPFTDTDFIQIAKCTQNEKYAIYAKDDADAGEAAYKLQYVINITVVDAAFADNAGIYQTDTIAAISGETAYVLSSNVQFRASKQSEIAASSVRYFVTDRADAPVSELTKASNYKAYNAADYAALSAKRIYVYAGLISNQADNRVLAYKPLGNVYVSKDETAPNIECTKVEESSDQTVYTEIKNDYLEGNLYYGDKKYYRYVLKITDDAAQGQDATGVASVTAKIGDRVIASSDISKIAEDGTYAIVIQKSDANGTNVLSVTAKDYMGNERPYTCQTIIKQITDSITVTEAKLDDTNLLLSESTFKQVSSQKMITVKLSATKNIADKVAKVTLTNGTKTFFAEGANLTIASPSKKRVCEITARFFVPTDVTKTEILNGLKIRVYDSASGLIQTVDQSGTAKEYTLQNILYDAVAPEVTAAKIEVYVPAEGSTPERWDTIVTNALDTTKTFTTQRNQTYRYVVTVSDDINGSGVNPEEVKAGTSKFQRIGETNQYELGLGGMTSDSYTPYVTVADQAGNIHEAVILQTINKINDSISVDKVKITYTDDVGYVHDVTKSIADKLYNYTNKQHVMTVDVSSSCKIDAVTLYYQGGSVIGTIIKGNDNPDKNNRYHATIQIKLPEVLQNTFFRNMYLTVTDIREETDGKTIRYPNDTEKTLGDVLYDQTRPVITVTKDDKTNLDNEWHSSYRVNYSIKSGNSTSDESPLASAGYILKSGEEKAIDTKGQTAIAGQLTIPKSDSVAGTAVTFKAEDNCENSTGVRYFIKVDPEAPKIPTFTINDNAGKDGVCSVPVSGSVNVSVKISDNLTLKNATMTITDPQGKTTLVMLSNTVERENIEISDNYDLASLLKKELVDGNYKIVISATDKAGNNVTKSLTFKVDNTKPTVTAKIIDGTTAGKDKRSDYYAGEYDYYYREPVTLLFTCFDTNIDASNIVVTDSRDGGNSQAPLSVSWTKDAAGLYQTTCQIAGSGTHRIKIAAVDKAGNYADERQIDFVYDDKAPVVSAVINGGILYSESMGQLDLTSNPTIHFSVQDDIREDVNDFNYQLIKTLPDQLPVTADVLRTDNRSFSYSDEGEYEIHAYSIDMAGNKSAERVIKFRLDKEAPKLEISGAASGSSLQSGTTLTFTMTEAFWKDASGTITITRKAKDGASESTYKTIDVKPTGRVTRITQTLDETGEYKVTFTGKDRAGHTAENATYTVKIDTEKPVITLNGVKNNDKTTGQVEFQAQIEEDFYLTKTVSIDATRTYLDESNKEKTEPVKFTGYNPSADTTLIQNTFKDDGIYNIKITCKDAAGNQDVQEVSFTIDKTKPVVDEKVLAAYTGKLTAFTWDYDLDDIVQDLTVCDVHMYLNGGEYDGTSEIEDGAYEMKISAVDELGNETEETADFTLDTKAPTFIVTGVEDGDAKNEEYSIAVSLQLDEDTLDSVTLNGKAIEIKDGQATISVTEKGKYELSMKAHDEAGNEAEKTIHFTYGNNNHMVMYIIIAIAALLVIGGIFFVIVAKKKK